MLNSGAGKGVEMPILVTALVAKDHRTESGFRFTLAATHRAIDAPALECLGLTPGEQAALYNAACAAIRYLPDVN